MPGGRSRVKTTVNTSDLLLLIEQTEIDIFYDHFLELLCWQVARRSRVTTTVNTSSANGRASYYCADYRFGWMSLRRYSTGTVQEWILVTPAMFPVISNIFSFEFPAVNLDVYYFAKSVLL